jgi:hypothetical protein
VKEALDRLLVVFTQAHSTLTAAADTRNLVIDVGRSAPYQNLQAVGRAVHTIRSVSLVGNEAGIDSQLFGTAVGDAK